MILLFPLLKKFSDCVNDFVFFGLSGIVYFISYLLEFKFHVSGFFIVQLYLLGRCLFSFVLGMLFYKYNWIGVLKGCLKSVRFKNGFLFVLVLAAFLFHCVVQSLIVAPITALIVLCCFHVWDKPAWVERLFYFLGRHSTNVWLIHMFFYLCLFEDFIFVFKFPILILIMMFVICIVCSYVIDWIESSVLKIL